MTAYAEDLADLSVAVPTAVQPCGHRQTGHAL